MCVSRTVEPTSTVSRCLSSGQSFSRIVIANFNANFLRGHLDLIEAYLDLNFYHMMSISETWLYAGIKLVRLGDYLLLRNDRGRSTAGV